MHGYSYLIVSELWSISVKLTQPIFLAHIAVPEPVRYNTGLEVLVKLKSQIKTCTLSTEETLYTSSLNKN